MTQTHTPEHFDVLIVGAGISGIGAGSGMPSVLTTARWKAWPWVVSAFAGAAKATPLSATLATTASPPTARAPRALMDCDGF